MATIICKKCGSPVRADDGVCPVCGTVYYVIPQEGASNAPPHAAGSGLPEQDLDITRVWQLEPDQEDAETEWETDDVKIYTPSSSRNNPAAQSAGRTAQRPAEPYRQESAYGANPNARRTAEQTQQTRRPTESTRRSNPDAASRRTSESARRSGESAARRPAEASRQQRTQRELSPRERKRLEKERKKQRKQQRRRNGRAHEGKARFAVLAVALLAVLVVIIGALSGAFDFSKSTERGAMPNVVGMQSDDAVKQLEDLGGISVKIQKEESSEKEGTVIRQDPAEGVALRKGDVVTLTVSGDAAEKPEVVSGNITLPTVKDLEYDAAVRKLEALGLHVTRGGDVYSDDVKEGHVATMSPDSGTSVPEGSTVVLSVSKGKNEVKSFTISVTAGQGGSVSPNGSVKVESGSSASFTITPNTGYEVREVKVDGVDVGAVTSYSFSRVTANHTLYVVFQKTASQPTQPEQPTEPDTPSQPDQPSQPSQPTIPDAPPAVVED